MLPSIVAVKLGVSWSNSTGSSETTPYDLDVHSGRFESKPYIGIKVLPITLLVCETRELYLYSSKTPHKISKMENGGSREKLVSVP